MTDARELSVSVVVPCFNVEPYLARTVASALSQTWSPREILLIDDGSEDGTGALADDLARRHAPVRVIHQANGGVCAARNTGIRSARGDFVGFLDGDDTWRPHLLASLMPHFTDTEAVAAGGEVVWANPTGSRRIGRDRCAARFDQELVRAGRQMPWSMSACVVRREAALNCGLFDEALASLPEVPEDMDFFARLARCGRLVCVPDVLGEYVLRAPGAAPSLTDKRNVDLARGAAFVRHRLNFPHAEWQHFDFHPHPGEVGRVQSSLFMRTARAAYVHGRPLTAVGWAARALTMRAAATWQELMSGEATLRSRL